MKSHIFLPCMITIVITIMGIVSMFLPYICATQEFAEFLRANPNEQVVEGVDVLSGDLEQVSLFEYVKLYLKGGDKVFHSKDAGVFTAIVYAAPSIFCFFALLCALSRKATPLIFQSLFIAGCQYLVNFDVTDRGIMPASNRVWGITHVAYYPIAAVLFICGIWLFAAKCHMKKQRKRV